MACILPPTGLPTLPSDGITVAAKGYNASLGLLTPLIVNGYVDSFDVEWVVDSSITDQTIFMIYKDVSLPDFETPRASSDQATGVVASQSGYSMGTEFDFWLRRETLTEYGPWYQGNAICMAGWTSDVNFVYRLTIEVEYGGEPVVYVI